MSQLRRPVVFLLTDFGLADHYAAVMKAVILRRCNDVAFVDITHQVPPQSVESGLYLLESSWPWLPDDSILLAVVDPGVGSDREPAIFHHEGKTVIGPNNGLFGFLPEGLEGRVLDRPEFWEQEVSHTFHGRDIFGPCAGHIAAGSHWTLLGDRKAYPIRLAQPAGGLDSWASGHIIHFDDFGNAITDIRQRNVAAETALTVAEVAGKLKCPLVRTYADVPEGKPLAYWGSAGRLELAVRGGSARRVLGLEVSDMVSIE